MPETWIGAGGSSGAKNFENVGVEVVVVAPATVLEVVVFGVGSSVGLAVVGTLVGVLVEGSSVGLAVVGALVGDLVTVVSFSASG